MEDGASLFATPHVSKTLSVRLVQHTTPAARSTRVCLLACRRRTLGAARYQVVAQGRSMSFRAQRLCGLCDRSNQPYWTEATPLSTAQSCGFPSSFDLESLYRDASAEIVQGVECHPLILHWIKELITVHRARGMLLSV